MPTTNRTAPAGSWLKISDNLQNVLITNGTMTKVRVHVGTADPASDAAYHFCTHDRDFAMAGVSGQKVYIRSDGDAPVPVTVTAV